MENPIYIALSRQDALRRQMDVTANNVANLNTPGYKQQRMMFVEFLTPAGSGPGQQSKPLSMVKDMAVLRNLEDGPVSRTDNPLDVALDGRGYFVVETVDGPRYTRAGRFQLDPDRRLVDVNGLPVLDDGDRPIQIPQGAADIRIAGDGSISTEQGPLGRIKVVNFEREQFMTELGGGLYTTEEPEVAAEGTKLVQGAIEGSNVQGIVEMTQMTEVLRQYQSNQRLIEAEHERQRNAIGRLTRVG
ncbi:flagellar basal-body rod protein FlgF [Arenibaculum sp.]|jgi:flagellar basal-body rod protein FlgF|uniref:flagellar basal-body rod protein FlgF n=1 Tax=Arenibaculum sp. TaxID=2865862 RepID=UPI002E1487B3|nr:flagellar basal-body rod protein FlgF [Arenibaculum sp.]